MTGFIRLGSGQELLETAGRYRGRFCAGRGGWIAHAKAEQPFLCLALDMDCTAVLFQLSARFDGVVDGVGI